VIDIASHIAAKFGTEVLKASIFGNIPAAKPMYRLLNEYFTGGNIVETGTFCGLSTAVLAMYADHVYTFDISPRCFIERGSKGEREAKLQSSDPETMCEAIWHELAVRDKITPIIVPRGTSPDVSGIDFSFAFVDGDHTTEGVTRDFEAVKHCGKVLFHDYPNIAEVKDFVNSLTGTVIVDEPLAMWLGDDSHETIRD